MVLLLAFLHVCSVLTVGGFEEVGSCSYHLPGLLAVLDAVSHQHHQSAQFKRRMTEDPMQLKNRRPADVHIHCDYTLFAICRCNQK